MIKEGPILERLSHRLSECPADFLAEPRIGQRGGVYVDAVISDLLMDLGGDPLSKSGAGPFQATDKKDRNRLRLVLVSSWLCHDEWFRQREGLARPVYAWLKGGLGELGRLVAADLFVSDPDRREELARLCLEALEFVPYGETDDQAADRLNTLSSVERNRVIKATKAQQARTRKLREAMQRKQAREAAAKVSHE